MKNKLFVSNIDFDVTVDQLKDMFDKVAEGATVVIATDRETKRSKGFAFVEMDNDEDAEKAINELNNKALNGRPMKVCYDRGKGGGSTGNERSGERGSGEKVKREYLPPIQRMQLFKRRKKLDPFLEDPSKSVDYKDVGLLTKFVSERGRILSRRMTGLTAYNQRQVAKAIKRAQSLGLMPYQR